MSDERRIPCPGCGAQVLRGAKKCRQCKSWLNKKEPSRLGRFVLVAGGLTVTLVAGLLATRDSHVGEAPPLTPTAVLSSQGPVATAPTTPSASARLADVLSTNSEVPSRWKSRTIAFDIRPLDVVLHQGQAYVSAADSTLRQYDLKSGKLARMLPLKILGDHLRLLHGRFVIAFQSTGSPTVRVIDLQNWDKEPMALWIGHGPVDVVALPGTTQMITASRRGQRLTHFELPSGKRLGDLTLPHAAHQVLVLKSKERTLVGALGRMHRGGRSVGAWLDIFDPKEAPFGATRRSVSVGREPRDGMVALDGSFVLLPDVVSNAAALVALDGVTKLQTIPVGRTPIAAYLLNEDHHGITLDQKSKTLTVFKISDRSRLASLSLGGRPIGGQVSPSRKLLVVTAASEPNGRRAEAIFVAGSPPRVVARVKTGDQPARIDVPSDKMVVVLSRGARTLSVMERDDLEPQPTQD